MSQQMISDRLKKLERAGRYVIPQSTRDEVQRLILEVENQKLTPEEEREQEREIEKFLDEIVKSVNERGKR